MSLFSVKSGQAQARMVQASAVLLAALLAAGCGAGYRPVITPINPSGPSAQPTAYAVVVSATTTTAPGIASVIDYAGDTLLTQAAIGPGPRTFTLDETGSDGYSLNSDGTLTNFQVSSNEPQEKDIHYTTLPANSNIVSLLSPSAGLWGADQNGNVTDVLAGFPASFKLAVPVAATPVLTIGPGLNTERNYAITQNIADPTGVACNVAPRAAGAAGQAEAIETTTYTVSARIPLGKCPVYAVESPDAKRVFVLNRGDDTITVINSQNNTLNACTPYLSLTGRLVTCHPTLPLSTSAGLQGAGVPAIAGPVYAEYNSATGQLVVANYDGNAVTIIDVSLDEFGNDSATFGATYTIPVGASPASVTALYDGTRAYTANQADGTVSVVNMQSHTFEKTLPVNGHPRTVVSVQNSLYGKVYAASPDSPYLSIIRTDQDIIDTAILVPGNIVDVRTSNQNGSQGNAIIISRMPGFGQPCYLPPTLLSPAAIATNPSACSKLP